MKQTEEQKKEFKRLRLSQKQSYERWYSLLTSKNEETREYRIHEILLEYFDSRDYYEKLQEEIEELKNN
ncbi:hypothetical protein OAG30_00200 [Flavobacteriaceae bacterium]|nr:hypothetical protein [Flavobacteriaceae bacterium]